MIWEEERRAGYLRALLHRCSPHDRRSALRRHPAADHIINITRESGVRPGAGGQAGLPAIPLMWECSAVRGAAADCKQTLAQPEVKGGAR